jgi:hypothetical protein
MLDLYTSPGEMHLFVCSGVQMQNSGKSGWKMQIAGLLGFFVVNENNRVEIVMNLLSLY